MGPDMSCSLAVFTLLATGFLNLICIDPSTSELGCNRCNATNALAISQRSACMSRSYKSEREEFIEREQPGYLAQAGRRIRRLQRRELLRPAAEA
jgi:hypothetical protein